MGTHMHWSRLMLNWMWASLLQYYRHWSWWDYLFIPSWFCRGIQAQYWHLNIFWRKHFTRCFEIRAGQIPLYSFFPPFRYQLSLSVSEGCGFYHLNVLDLPFCHCTVSLHRCFAFSTIVFVWIIDCSKAFCISLARTLEKPLMGIGEVLGMNVGQNITFRKRS